METIHLALPEPLQEYVQRRVAQGGYSDAGEYIRELIRADRKAKAQRELETLILEGLQSGPSEPVTAETWEEIWQEVVARHEPAKSEPVHD